MLIILLLIYESQVTIQHPSYHPILDFYSHSIMHVLLLCHFQ